MYKTLLRPCMIFVPLLLGQLFPQAHVLGKAPFHCIKYALILMLFLTFLKLEFREMRLKREHFMVVAVNILLGIVPFFLLKTLFPAHPDPAKAAFYVGITPTAAAAPAVVSFLNGRTGFALTGFILSYAVISLALFLFLPVVSGKLSISFLFQIFLPLSQIVFLPCLLAFLVRKLFPGAKALPGKCALFTFSLWSFTLFLMSATAKMHFIRHPNEPVGELFYIAILSAVLCFLSFFLGGKLARKKYARESSQILGQKNTSFTMFLALEFANPLVAIGPIFYIVCHNSWNAVQMFLYDLHRRKRAKRALEAEEKEKKHD
ncbi:MAG: hypothetical protein J6331_03925 [Lentisphaeria bacterium]|nr:hypothetical protein [Lentisphaeria bacterium]